MLDSASTTLKITISHKTPGYDIDGLPEHDFTFEADMIDCSVHAWFDIFARVLAYEGFSEENICAGGCQLAFNEYRKPEMMKKIADRYELKMIEYSDSEEDEEI